MIKNRDEKKIVKDKYEDIEIDFSKFNDTVPNHYIG